MRVATIVGLGALMGCGRVAFDPLVAGGVDADGSPDAVTACSAPYQEMNGGCYRFVLNQVELPWLEAETACESDGPGAHLLVIDDDAELALAVNTISTINDAWIGVSDVVTPGVYLRVTGGPAFTPWGAGQPGSEHCLQVLSAGGVGDRTCDAPNDYVCERDGRAVDPTAF